MSARERASGAAASGASNPVSNGTVTNRFKASNNTTITNAFNPFLTRISIVNLKNQLIEILKPFVPFGNTKLMFKIQITNYASILTTAFVKTPLTIIINYCTNLKRKILGQKLILFIYKTFGN
ncbi:hypothetical protein GGTG_11537 [Gaeumannomyces tritici R3-111a-1]|uniref:Uncharacterized protein n=1 Tax=Gaeumannomyces tritici (strain R3-111a-1) TaxID=644352 RepID=J3PDG6_GAET3|nr:hypothetical protein GGTG_11537 [Gaeumannomyces tritici R3-111a-1]EJT70514.1 hypothetical protein GGTG_11537 [Gaeumannomyces tritici R3-111a-1]